LSSVPDRGSLTGRLPSGTDIANLSLYGTDSNEGVLTETAAAPFCYFANGVCSNRQQSIVRLRSIEYADATRRAEMVGCPIR